MTLLWISTLAIAALAAPPAQNNPPTLARVVLIGDSLFEGDYADGFLEAALTAASPDHTITVRNLGWTADTVQGDSRAGFETAKEGFDRRARLVADLMPTHILVAYGMNESFNGQPGLAAFVEQLNSLLDSLTPTAAHITLVSPIAHENLGPPLPDPNEHNKNLALYRDAIHQVAQERNLPFADLLAAGIGTSASNATPDTTDGIHLTQSGYRRVITPLLAALPFVQPTTWDVSLDRDGQMLARPLGTSIRNLVANTRSLQFQAVDLHLPLPGSPRRLRVAALEPGAYLLTIDGREVARRTHDDWGNGVTLDTGPEFNQLESLRHAVVAKNTLLFHRLRPQNETYLFGFRKHEQGQNAREVPEFDPLVAEKETEIDRLKRPVPHTYELTRMEDTP